MRNTMLFGLISLCIGSGAFAQQDSNSAGAAASAPSIQEPGQKSSASLEKLSKQACASICTKSEMEISLTDEDKKRFNQCADALFCLNPATTNPLASQPRNFDFPFLIRDFLTRTPNPEQQG
jgi:hypothetical protein